MKLLLKLTLALAVGAVCVALVVQDIDFDDTWRALSQVSAPVVAVYLVTLAITHLFRVWRWKYLLRPISVSLGWRDLASISSVGFLAIQALPVRLGELVRPYLVVRTGQARTSAVLGTVAVERIVDGVIISLLFFAAFLGSPEGAFSRELEIGAWISLLAFVAAMGFLAASLRWTEPTIRLAVALTLLPRTSPRLATKLHDKLGALIRGFTVLSRPRDLVPFLVQSILYWGTNGLGMWLLARGMGLSIGPMAAYAAMAFTGILITLPNSPGLVGQFHLGVVAALAVYLPGDVATKSTTLAYATLLHGIQLLWYTAAGLASLPFVPGHQRLRDVIRESNRALDEPEEPLPAPPAPLAERFDRGVSSG